jgi:hypothetical protein
MSFTSNGQTFETVAIARRVLVDGWTHVPAAAPDADGRLVGGCTWMVEYCPEPIVCDETGEVDFWDDPQLPIRDCGAEVAYNDDRWECAAGHEHTSAEARDREGWDYAADAYDAAVIGRGGKLVVPAGPTTYIDPYEVAHIAAQIC